MAKKKDPMPMTVSSEGIMETKLTRSEAIELMVEEAEKRTQERIAALEEESRRELSLTPAQVHEVALSALANTAQLEHWQGSDGTTGMRFAVGKKFQPGWLRDKLKHLAEIKEEQSHLSTVLWSLRDRTKARLEILRGVLERSAEGRDFLERIAQMSVALGSRMLERAKEPAKPRLLEASTTVKVTTTVKEA